MSTIICLDDGEAYINSADPAFVEYMNTLRLTPVEIIWPEGHDGEQRYVYRIPASWVQVVPQVEAEEPETIIIDTPFGVETKEPPEAA